MCNIKKQNIFAVALQKQAGALAQLVEQWTENPCVPGSIPGGTTRTRKAFIETSINAFLFYSTKDYFISNLLTVPLPSFPLPSFEIKRTPFSSKVIP